MSRSTSRSTEQYSSTEHVPAGPTNPSLAHGSLGEVATGAAVASVLPLAVVLAVSVPAVAVAGLAAVAAVLVGRATIRREEAHLEHDATPARSTESASTGTVPAAD
jgi:lipid-binding SYLF domain-containing protein